MREFRRWMLVANAFTVVALISLAAWNLMAGGAAHLIMAILQIAGACFVAASFWGLVRSRHDA